MKIEVIVKTDQLDAYIRNLSLIDELFENGARDIGENARKSIMLRQSRNNRVKRGKRGYHWTSKAGFPPNNDFGRLAGSIKHERDRTYKGGIAWIVKATAKYAIPLEIGTRKMAPRPFMVPALERVRPSLLMAIESVLRK